MDDRNRANFPAHPPLADRTDQARPSPDRPLEASGSHLRIPDLPPGGGRGGFLLSLFLFLSLLSACTPSTPATRTADDQDVTRDILWELRKDPRFGDVRVTCYDRTITLEGTVSDRAAQDEALRLAGQRAPGAKIVNSLIVRRR